MKRLAVVAIALAIGSMACGSSSTSPSTPPAKPTFTADLRPANEVPPITVAAITYSSAIWPIECVPEFRREVVIIEAIAASPPISTNSSTSTRLVGRPDSSAASGLPP